MPWANNTPLIRLACATRSATSVLRSRQSLRRSSSSGLGALTMVQTRGSPRLYAKSVRSSASPWMRLVFARRRRREVKIEAASTTWLSMPACSSTRCTQKPSRPASRMVMIGKLAPARACAYDRSIEPADKRGITENIRWLLSKTAPTRFGERLLVAGDQESPIRHLHESVDAGLAVLSQAQLNALESFAKAMIETRAGEIPKIETAAD